MNTFKGLKNILNKMGIINGNLSLKSTIKSCVYFGLLGTSPISTAIFLSLTDKTTRGYTQCLFETSVLILNLVWYAVLFWRWKTYNDLIIELHAKILKRIKDPDTYVIYHATNRKIEIMTEKMVLAMRTFSIIYGLLDLMFSILLFITIGYPIKSYKQIYNAWLYPFDWKTPFGFIGCISIQVAVLFSSADVYISAIVLTVGFCLFIVDFANDIEQKLRQLNKYVLCLNGKKLTDAERNNLKKKLIDIFGFYSEAREFTIRFSHANSAIVFACPVYAIAVFGSLVMQAKTLLQFGDVFANAQAIVAILVSSFPLFLFCHFGGNVTDRLENVAEAVYELEWYEFPLDMQKDLQVMMAMAQKSIYIRGYGDSRSTHSVFLKIFRNKFCYFVLLRKC